MLSCNVCNLMAARLHQLQVVRARHAPQSNKQNDGRQCRNNGQLAVVSTSAQARTECSAGWGRCWQ